MQEEHWEKLRFTGEKRGLLGSWYSRNCLVALELPPSAIPD